MNRSGALLCCCALLACRPGRPAMLRVESAWARPAEAGDNTAVYATIVNDGGATGTVSGVRCADAPMAHLHRSYNQDGMARMRAVETLMVPAGEHVFLAPGGLHLMVMGLTRPLVAGDSLNCVIRVASGDSLPLVAAVRSP